MKSLIDSGAQIKILFVSAVIVRLVNSASQAVDDLVLSLPNGQIQGASYVTTNNVTYHGFRGIPYAIPPVGDLRFEVAQPAKSWEGILDATKDQKACLGEDYFNNTKLQSEDCLYINVYVPVLNSTKKLPVMFWIYGGGFSSGSSYKTLYGPDYLIEKEVIIVSFNYRLIAFGFISTEDDVLPGNLGLKDQALALNWTRRNIEYFGGDPEKITIFGESAGGASTGLHLVSKLSAGLFRAAIVESGSALTYWTIDRDARTSAFLIGAAIPGGTYGNNSTELKQYLKNKSADEIVTASNVLLAATRLFTAVIEVESENAFLTEAPYQLLKNGNFNQVPIVIGICAEEALLFLKNIPTTEVAAIAADTLRIGVIPPDLRPKTTDEGTVITEINSIYLKDLQTYALNLSAFADHFTDVGFSNGVLKHAYLTSKYAPVYLYQFAYYGRPVIEAFIPGAEKASHGAEIPFLFNTTFASYTTISEDLRTQLVMTTLWTNFAKDLNPTSGAQSVFGGLVWPKLNLTTAQYLNINITLEVKDNLKGAAYSKWIKIYDSYGTKPFITF